MSLKSLIRLLAVGCSLGRVADRPNRYRILRQGLPKFGRPEKPSAAGPARAAERNRNANNTMQHVEVNAKPWSASAAATASAAAIATSAATATAAVEQTKPTQAQRFPQGRWSLFRNPFAFGNTPSKASRPVEPVAPVQGEFSLDAVRPVRNDLTDSDVMVIRSPKAEAESVTEPVQRLAGAEACVSGREPVWSRLKHQFFGADKA
jgi:hypothetical protein